MPDKTQKYETNFLTNVIVQLDYRPVVRFLNEVPNDIIDELKNSYEFHQNKISSVNVNIATGAKIETIIPVWEFVSKDADIDIQLTQNFLKFNCTKYTHFENLMSHVNKITKLLENDVQTFNRVGLRYINQIDMDEENPTDWSNYINEALICNINSWCQDSKDKITRAMSQIVISEDDYSLNFNYGIYNPIFPNQMIQKQFILDFDCYAKKIEMVEITQKLTELNAIITQSFEKSIKKPLRDKMGVISNDKL